MKREMIKKFDNADLLKEICEVYNYDVKFDNGKVLCIDDNNDDCDVYKYENIELALIDWLETLIESEREYIFDNIDATWGPEIKHIKDIKTKIMFNKNSNSIEECLLYGRIPEHMKQSISVFLDEKIKRTDEFLKKVEANNFSFKAYKVSLPTEFIIQDNELKYIKIANKSFLERLILEGDDSEIEFNEKDVYSKDGLVENMPLIAIETVNKFELDIPVAITILNGYIRIQNPINYLHLF